MEIIIIFVIAMLIVESIALGISVIEKKNLEKLMAEKEEGYKTNIATITKQYIEENQQNVANFEATIEELRKEKESYRSSYIDRCNYIHKIKKEHEEEKQALLDQVKQKAAEALEELDKERAEHEDTLTECREFYQEQIHNLETEIAKMKSEEVIA